ncbi:hypothetical protein TPL01_32160 [Sulfuriferula plumbiphila]|uniref:Uncharacterized protein n=1 Tax=Sulfuriferula plumbiphila TaxID=171865 RepID=A0A512LC57_9PROT|nr:hypothetical protein [Sulfuriferula plumbiphila]BBP04078.1 hypothetical protein SFPGR_15000 [Sulfuriferula plumbiphila]GEP32078.1 hypothetical protein TPL01_32160 [Sulfuriferula plumbiphila]
MSRSWNNFILVLLLALLQGIAPLLHAHVLEFSMPHKIHIDGLELDLPHSQPDAGVHQLKLHVDDSTAIGMESTGKNDREERVVNAPILGTVAAVLTLPRATAPPLPAFLTASTSPPSGFYFLPPAHAPPGANPR